MKVTKVVLRDVRSDQWSTLVAALGLSDEEVRQYFEFKDYASVELEINHELRVVGGRLLPLDRRGRR